MPGDYVTTKTRPSPARSQGSIRNWVGSPPTQGLWHPTNALDRSSRSGGSPPPRPPYSDGRRGPPWGYARGYDDSYGPAGGFDPRIARRGEDLRRAAARRSAISWFRGGIGQRMAMGLQLFDFAEEVYRVVNPVFVPAHRVVPDGWTLYCGSGGSNGPFDASWFCGQFVPNPGPSIRTANNDTATWANFVTQLNAFNSQVNAMYRRVGHVTEVPHDVPASTTPAKWVVVPPVDWAFPPPGAPRPSLFPPLGTAASYRTGLEHLSEPPRPPRGPVYSQSPSGTLVFNPNHDVRPPRRGERERKTLANAALVAVAGAAFVATEFKDLINILYGTLPKDIRRATPRTGVVSRNGQMPGMPYVSLQDKINAVNDHWDDIDWQKAWMGFDTTGPRGPDGQRPTYHHPGLIENALRDFIVGGAMGQAQRNLRRVFGSSHSQIPPFNAAGH